MIEVPSPRFNMRLNLLLHPLKLARVELYYAKDSIGAAKYFYKYTGQLNGPFGKVHSLLCLAIISKYLPLSHHKIIEVQIEKFLDHPFRKEFKDNHPVVYLFTMLFQSQFEIRHTAAGMDILFEELLILDKQYAVKSKMQALLNEIVENPIEQIDPLPVYEDFIVSVRQSEKMDYRNHPFARKLLGFIELTEFLDRIYVFLTRKVNNALFRDCVLNIYRVEFSKISYGYRTILQYFELLERLIGNGRDTTDNRLELAIDLDAWELQSKALVNQSKEQCQWLIEQETDNFIGSLLEPVSLDNLPMGNNIVITEEAAYIE